MISPVSSLNRTYTKPILTSPSVCTISRWFHVIPSMSLFSDKIKSIFFAPWSAKAVEDAWKDPAFLKEQRRICGDDKEYVFPYKRKSGTVKE
eukprot:COSAG03_NODE_304_length_9180_cov_78.498293_3_plen_92_part_00